ncbi:RNA polymerase sigma factor SigJ [Streptomyces sulphureus]|uniref:RNA polymerase sigma factor SigJ n=1 Tax=Streptomyces sulphureus TaxID=47758 RepID=UPI00037E3582|nr:RNA polymerase sigma factor SigJ [Streptomyces sulphureus]
MTADGEDETALAEAFEAERPRLLRVAYTTTGSLAEAEDCVQEAWLRLRRLADPSEVRDLRGWLTTVVARLALDTLGSARARREQYVGTWLPEPLVRPEGDGRGPAPDPADRVTLDESVSMALLVVLEQLSPAQRTAFVLHDVFAVPFDEVAEVVGRSPAAVRQLAARARRDLRRARPSAPATADEQRAVVRAFTTACEEGDLAALTALLDPDVVCRGDGGGRVAALPRPLRGAARVAHALLRLLRGQELAMSHVTVNGEPGLALRSTDGVLSVLAFTVDGGRITALDAVRNPEKLRHVTLRRP